jgi:stearoyl-CoA desaturase (Delta-9 desaturase)
MRIRALSYALALPYAIIHLSAFSVLLFPFSWKLVALCVGSYYLRMFFLTAGYHRYFSHRSFRMGRVAQFAFAFLASTTLQKGVLWWAAHHRHHHRHSDQPEDVHSPVQKGFFWAHMGWVLSEESVPTRWELIRDFASYPELRWVDRWYWVPGALYGLAILAIWGWPGVAWGFALSTILLYHGTYTINSLAHVFGSRRYRTTDSSRNNPWLALLTLGEGWHNNHHAYMSSARQGFRWWELDASYLALRALGCLGVVRDLREPPLELLEARLGRGSVGPAPARAEARGGLTRRG